MDSENLVVSSLGITRQADGLGYRDVDFQANLNLLHEAETAGVKRFAYIHVLNAEAKGGERMFAAAAQQRAMGMPRLH